MKPRARPRILRVLPLSVGAVLALALGIMTIFGGTKAAYDVGALIKVPRSTEASMRGIPLLGPSSRISVVTMWPGKPVYIAFGHSAIRVEDPDQELDLMFNYGIFNFDVPFFVPRFVYGDLQYLLGVYPFARQIEIDQRYENRIWKEQVLDLDVDDRQRLFEFLAWNSQEDHAAYRYDFVRDNCSTRVYDALWAAFGDRLDPGSPRGEPIPGPGATARSLLQGYVADRPQWAFLFDLALGRAVDQPLRGVESWFLPQYLLSGLRGVSLDGRPLVVHEGDLFTPDQAPDLASRWADPGFVLWPLALATVAMAVMAARGWVRGQALHPILRQWSQFMALVLALGGVVVWYLGYLSLHTATRGNLHALWLHPGWVLILWSARKGGLPGAWRQGFLAFTGAGLALLPMLGGFWLQPTHHGIVALWIMALGVWVIRVADHFATRKV